jgi:hypothetical protein
VTSLRQDLGGWRRDILWDAARGTLPIDRALQLTGITTGSDLHDRAHTDLTAARDAQTAGDPHTAEALISDLAVTIRAQRTHRTGRKE